MSIAAAKQRLRREIGALRRGIDPARRALAGDALARHVLAWSGLLPGRRVALYAALPDELPTDALLRGLLARGHPVLLPRGAGPERLAFARVHDPTLLVVGTFGALEPPPDAPAASLREDDLLLLPGVAFDRSGARLGRGGGWYDRSLPGSVRDLFGVAFELQLVDRVPDTATDRRVRGVFTELGLHLCERDARREPQRDPS